MCNKVRRRNDLKRAASEYACVFLYCGWMIGSASSESALHVRETFNKSRFLSIRKKISMINSDGRSENSASSAGHFT